MTAQTCRHNIVSNRGALMPTPASYAAVIHRWCASMNVTAMGNPDMVKDYIDTRWPTLSRAARNNIFKAAMRPVTA